MFGSVRRLFNDVIQLGALHRLSPDEAEAKIDKLKSAGLSGNPFASTIEDIALASSDPGVKMSAIWAYHVYSPTTGYDKIINIANSSDSSEVKLKALDARSRSMGDVLDIINHTDDPEVALKGLNLFAENLPKQLIYDRHIDNYQSTLLDVLAKFQGHPEVREIAFELNTKLGSYPLVSERTYDMDKFTRHNPPKAWNLFSMQKPVERKRVYEGSVSRQELGV